MNVYGRVYMSTAGRGIVYAETGNPDCAGVPGGSAYLDNCNTCVGGNTGKVACIKDCHGEYGGKAYLDNCQTCVGGSTGMTACSKDCNGDWGGTAALDVCNVCAGGKTGKVPVLNQNECTVTSIDNHQTSEVVSVYPNPFNADFTIAAEGQFNYSVINFTGNIVAIGTAEGQLILGADLSAGMYLVKVETAGKTTIRKVVKY
jgi:xyloglucan-specific exo-beta-1,4-glucanase